MATESKVEDMDLLYVYDNSRLDTETIDNLYQQFCGLCPKTKHLGRRKFVDRVFKNQEARMFYDYLFRVFDEDNSGYLDFKEFAEIFDLLARGSEQEKLDLVFRMCDTDKSGTLEPHELKEFLSVMEKLSDEKVDIGSLVRRIMISVGRDDRVTKQEFIDGCMDEREFLDHFNRLFKQL